MMTTMCLQDDALLAIHLGEAPAADVRHAAICPLCTGRLGTLRADLARIDAHLALPPPPARRERSLRALAWVPLTLAAAAGLALVLLRPHAEAPTPPAAYNPEVVVFLDDLADALDPVDGYSGAEDTLEPLDATGDADVQGRANTAAAPVGLALGGGSTRGLDESFIGVGCDNGIQRG
ncbi:MAG: hypothetical protein E6J68_01270 [Deltaproteobacteria bacterium]|nr:MAG: hypothetical protein E6J68_01270 [Deltaproteobacteria bacterium]